jgi:hypothetical protein
VGKNCSTTPSARAGGTRSRSHFRILLSDAPRDTQAVVAAIVATPERDLTTRDLADATGIPVESIPGVLAEPSRLAAIVHGLPHKAGAPPWNMGYNDEGVWVFRCPERVARALR